MHRLRTLATAFLTVTMGALAHAGEEAPQMDATLPIYKMVRSLEDVQDQIVAGDIQAADMQRFMIGVIDRRLRTADPSEFEDARNVDAALIYAMSGGNPATLDTLIAHDARGNFDTRVSNALIMYLSGKGSAATKTLDDVAPEYKTTTIGPYLALIAANVIMEKKPDIALKYFDWARLVLPGTIVEEAALRRSLFITVKHGEVAKSARLARIYLSRFSKSPYAAQVADQVVTLIDHHHKELGNETISELLDWLDHPRQQELYLRVARTAAVSGEFEFAHWAAGQALALSEGKDDDGAKLANLYLGLSSVPTASLQEVQSVFANIPDELLGPKERKLKDAGTFILSEVERQPTLESLTQAPADKHDPKAQDAAAASQASHNQPKAASGGKPAGAAPAQAPDAKDSIDTFLTSGKTQLNAIDELMKKGDM